MKTKLLKKTMLLMCVYVVITTLFTMQVLIWAAQKEQHRLELYPVYPPYYGMLFDYLH
jgi:hypothetical protein